MCILWVEIVVCSRIRSVRVHLALEENDSKSSALNRYECLKSSDDDAVLFRSLSSCKSSLVSRFMVTAFNWLIESEKFEQ